MSDSLTSLSESTDDGGKWIEEFIKNPSPSQKDFKKARIITSHRATMVRAHSAITARERVHFSLAKIIAGDDPEEAKKYLDASKPK